MNVLEYMQKQELRERAKNAELRKSNQPCCVRCGGVILRGAEDMTCDADAVAGLEGYYLEIGDRVCFYCVDAYFNEAHDPDAWRRWGHA